MSKFNCYEFDNVDDVNEVAGIYAWYGVCKFGKADWGSADDFINSINSEMKKFRSPKLDASIKSSFGLRWETSFTETTTERWIKDIESSISSDESAAGVSNLEDALSIESNREILCRVLNSAFPFFNTPIYVGMSGNLAKRIKKHKSQVDDIFGKKIAQPDRSMLFDKGDCFAERVFGAGFSPNQLQVCTIELPSLLEKNEIQHVSESELVKIAKIAEYFINRRIKPSLGRV
ncbi:GIY-YIG nuclease family protein [Aeromonas media]|uniref:hypothetical protein n=1 Tax=Aeromonas media TaxID=651 RepID=UPI0038D0551E